MSSNKENITREAAGPVAADSLAAESFRAGGNFSDNRGAEPLSVIGASSTLATTDTSAATRLDPAVDAESRQAQDDWGEESQLSGAAGLRYPEGAGGQGQFTGTHSQQGYVGGASVPQTGSTFGGNRIGGFGEDKTSQQTRADSGTFGDIPSSTKSADAGGSTESSNLESHGAGVAPSYVHGNVEPGMKPKGRDLTEGGFDSGTENASFNNEIGGPNDPARAAIGKIVESNANSNEAAGMAPSIDETSGRSMYDPLRDLGSSADSAGSDTTQKASEGGRSEAGQINTSANETQSSKSDIAPTYVKADVLNQPIHSKPKGVGLTEGGFDSDAKNSSFESDIGGKDDPGKAAIDKFVSDNANSREAAGMLPDQGRATSGQYGQLREEQS